jgi:hydrogenase expression/formation protein HypC
MCVALPGRIIAIIDPMTRLVSVDVMGAVRHVRVAITDAVAPGDWVLVEIGLAVQKLDEADARETVRMLEDMSRALEDDLAAAAEAGQGPGARAAAARATGGPS